MDRMRILRLTAVLALFGLAACGEPEPLTGGSGGAGASCRVPPASSVGYQDCGAATKGGMRCVALCGYLPGDGSPGALLSPGCTVTIGTSSVETAVCVSSCSDCQ